MRSVNAYYYAGIHVGTVTRTAYSVKMDAHGKSLTVYVNWRLDEPGPAERVLDAIRQLGIKSYST